jgi:hypothetical protein
LGCDQIFQFAPCAPHHNHPDYLHSTMGAHLLCSKSITHHNLQFGLKGFKRLLPSMVQSLLFYSTNSSRIWPTMKLSPTSLPPMWSNAPCPFVDQTIATNLCMNPKFCIQTILKTPSKFKVRCIVRIHLLLPKSYAPWPTYISSG